MVLDFYNLREQPFGVTPDPRFLCLGPSHREALASLSYGIQTGRGFMAIIADPGMGKTTILSQLLKQLEGTARTAFVFQTLFSAEDLIRSVLRDLGIADGNDLVQMQAQLNDVLAAEARQGRKVVVVIDEAQNLDHAALESLRMLSNFESPKEKLMQIVLGGQGQLREKLASPELLQLRQRMSIVARLHRFNVEETQLYIAHRLRVAGRTSEVPLFTPGAEALIAKCSDGIPRNINNICFNALSLGYVLKQHTIEKGVIREVLDDLDLSGAEFNGRSNQSIGGELFAWVTRARKALASQVFAGRRRLAVFTALLLPLIWLSGPGRSVRAVPHDTLPALSLAQPQRHPSAPSSFPNAATPGVSGDGQPDGAFVPTPSTRHASSARRARPLKPRPQPQSDTQTADAAQLWKQVKKKRTDAEVELARRYIEGTTLPQNCAQAQILLLAAYRGGNQHAAELLKNSTEQCP